MRHAAALLVLSFGLFASACSERNAFGPSDELTVSAAKSTTGKGGVGGSAGGIKGNSR